MSNPIDAPPARVPDRIVAGDTLKVSDSAAGAVFPAGEGWALAWVFVKASGGAVTTVAATAVAEAWEMTASAATTGAWASGVWRWVQRASKSGAVITVASGEVLVQPDPASANVDSRSHARRVLDLIEAAIEGRATSAALEHQFEDGRRIRFMTHEELLKMRDSYASKVRVEERAAKGLGASRILVRL
jgi:hypothetical protein